MISFRCGNFRTFANSKITANNGIIPNQLLEQRRYSANSLKKMRLFYDNWIMLDAISSVATDDLKNSTIVDLQNAEIELIKLM